MRYLHPDTLTTVTVLQLAELPNETLEQIMQSFLLPDDINNFSTCCKYFYNLLAKSFPKDKEMKKQCFHASYGSCDDVSGDIRFSGDLRSPHPVFLLRALFKYPDIAVYVKYLCIRDCSLSQKAQSIANDLEGEL